MNKSKGFTIIELIIVIAIIAVLAAIVLVNVTQYIAKSKDAAIQGNMASLMTNGATYYDTEHTYVVDETHDFCLSNFVATKPIFEQDPSGTKACVALADKWAACSQLIGTSADYWCVDSTGTKKQVAGATCSATALALAVCP